ncbi:MAG: hypothetical protein RLZZ528_447 [Pseudomonadota bacterium]
MTATAPPAPPARGDLAGAWLLAALWAAVMLALRWGTWGEDVAALYMAGHFWRQGAFDMLYLAPEGFFGGSPPGWLPAMQALGIGDRIAFPFVYPPIWAAALAPLTAILSPQGFCNLALALQVPMLAASALLAARITRPARLTLMQHTGVLLLLVTVLVPGVSALHFNQPTITATFLTLLAFERTAAGRPVAGGSALALAAAIKLSPAAFALVLLLDRQWRALAAFVVAGLLLGGLNLAIAPAGVQAAFLAALATATETVLIAPMNAGLRSALAILGTADLRAATAPLIHLPGASAADAALRAALPLALALAALALRRAAPPLRLSRGLVAVGLALPLFGPIGWLHYYLLPMLLLPGLALRSGAPLSDRALPLLAALLLLKPVFDLLTGLPGGQALAVLLIASVCLLLFLQVLRRPLGPRGRDHHFS